MKRLFANVTSSRIWIALGASLLVVAALLFVLAFLLPGSAAPEPESPTPTVQPTTAVPPTATPLPSPTGSTLVARVNDYTISQDYLKRATALNQVLSDFAGQESLGESETLQRLIKQELVLQGTPAKDSPSEEDVEDYIDRMKEAWGVDEERMVSELAAVSVERAFLEETIHRLLAVQAAVDALDAEGADLNTWLAEQEQDADIEVFQDVSELSTAPSEEPASSATPVPPTPTREPSAGATPNTPTPTRMRPPTATPAPRPDVPEVAPDFTLNQSGGGSLTLSEQLKEGPVVLVFFQRCG